MKSFLVLVGLLCLSAVAFAETDEHVVALTSSTFDAEVNKNDITLVEFYAPWCGHCKRLAPEYEKAAEALKGKAVLAKVDCTAEKDVCSKFDVRGYPTIKLFRKENADTPSEYNAGRTADAITKFMEKQTMPAYQELKTDADVEALAGRNEVTVAGFFADAASAEAFIKTAEVLRNDYVFGVAIGAEAASLASRQAASVPSVVLFKPFDEKKVVNTEVSTDRVELKKFITAESFPLLGEIGPDTYQKYIERGMNLVWCFVDPNADNTPAIKDTITEVAKQFRGKLSFVHLDGNRWGEHAKTFGLKSATPGIAIEDREAHKNYVYTESEITQEGLTTLVQGFLDKTIKPTLRTQEPPATNDAPVKVVVGKTFDEIVLDDSKDVFVKFYAPWCGHCKSLAPKWDELAASFESEPNVVIAKVDSTENDTPANIQGFPTLIFYPAGDKKNPVTYRGERSVEAMTKFIQEKATTLSKGAKVVKEEL